MSNLSKVQISMAKVYPQVPRSFSPYQTSKKETFTVWMKSLLYQTYGCTVYNTNGDIVYRVDNYDKKGSNEVHLMDLQGKVLSTIRRKVIISGVFNCFLVCQLGYLMTCTDFGFRLMLLCRNYLLSEVGMGINAVVLIQTKNSDGFKLKNATECLWETWLVKFLSAMKST